jgi:hypothetical protein
VGCFARFLATGSNPIPTTLRAGLGDLTLGLSSSAPEVFTVTPETVPIGDNGAQASLRGVAPGAAELRLKQPTGFGPSPDGSDTLGVTVALPTIPANCGAEFALGKDTQLTCSFPVPSGVVLTATSENPSLLIVSNDPKKPGVASVTATGNPQGAVIVFQALSAYGTAEVLITAPGYQDRRIAVALRQTILTLRTFSSAQSLSLRVGGGDNLTIDLRSYNGGTAPLRAGANLTVGFAPSPAGIVSFTPSQVVFAADQSSAGVGIKGVAAGSTLVRLSVPDGFTVATTPLVVTVTP